MELNQEPFKEYPDVVSIKEIQEMLNLGRNTVYRLLQQMEIKSIKVGKRYVIPKQSVINFLMGGA